MYNFIFAIFANVVDFNGFYIIISQKKSRGKYEFY